MTYPLPTCLFVFVFAVVVAVSAGRAFGVDPARCPFAAYEQLMPGHKQPLRAGYQCETGYGSLYTDLDFFYCVTRVTNQDGVRWVSVSGTDGVITRTSFSVRLRVGDLVAVLGAPQTIQRIGRMYSISWHGVQAYATGRRRGTLRMMDTVRYVAVTTVLRER